MHAVTLPSTEVAELLAQAEATLGHHPIEAGRLLDACLNAATPADAPVIARATYLLARVALFEGRADRSLELIAASRGAWMALDRPLDACRTELGRVHVLQELGRQPEAATAADRLLRELDETRSDDREDEVAWMRAAACENLGAALGSMGSHQRAIDAYARAESAYETIGADEDLARVRANRGIELIEMGRASEGLPVLHDAAALFEKGGDDLAVAKCFKHIGEGEMALGRHSAAFDSLERARLMFEMGSAPVDVARVNVALSSLMLELNLAEEAHDLAVAAREVFAGHRLLPDIASSSWHVALALLHLGLSRAALEPCDVAVAAFQEASDAAMAARVQLTRSEVHHRLGDKATALLDARGASATLRLSERPGQLALSLLWLAFLQHDDHERTESLLDECRRLAEGLGLPELRFLVAHRTGCLRVAQGDSSAARRELREAVRIAETLRGAIARRSLRTGFLLGRAGAHSDLMQLLLGAGTADDELAAFRISEMAKQLGAHMSEAPSSPTVFDGAAPRTERNDTSAALDRVLSAILEDLCAAYDALIGIGPGSSPEDHGALRDRVEALERAALLARIRCEDSNPESNETLDAACGTDRPPAAVEELTHAVGYHVIADEVIAFVWVAGQLRVRRNICSAASVTSALDEFDICCRRERSADGLGVGCHPALIRAAHAPLRRLYSALIEPIADLLHPDAPHLVIAPDILLAAVPFHALHDGADYLGRQWRVVIAESLTGRAPIRAIRPRLESAIVMSAADPSIPGATSEAETVARLLGVEALLGPRASFSVLADRAPRGGVVHVAGHGIHRPQRHGFSGVRLADQWLSPHDVHRLDVRGVLAVLSGCDTGLHVSRGAGDEPTGLGRAFLAAGADAVIVSLWPVHDGAAALFMTSFYGRLAVGVDADAAIDDARIAVCAAYPHPLYWAPFVLLCGS